MKTKRSRPSGRSTGAAKPLRKKHSESTHASPPAAGQTSQALSRAKSTTAPDIVKANLPIDWYGLLSRPPGEPDWLLKPFIARGKIISLYSKPKAGKSLVLLNLLHRALTGTHLDGSPAIPSTILYLDHENDDDDLHERLHAMGGEAQDLDNLVYLQFPEISPLDTKQGGVQLTALVEFYKPDLVVLDTVSRFIDGTENDATTWLNLYNHTLVKLKQRGVAVLRLDHTGRDEAKGARGSSAKTSDVDAAWSLKYDKEKNTRTLTRDSVRNAKGPDVLELRVELNPLNHLLIERMLDPVERLVWELDRLQIDPSKGRDTVRAELASHGVKASNGPLSSALKIRSALGAVGAGS